MPSALEIPFHIKTDYDSYDEYLAHQKSKLDNGIGWLRRYEGLYYTLLTNLLKRCELRFEDTCTLCLGARTGIEVKVFNDLGSFAVGIDVNSTSPCKPHGDTQSFGTRRFQKRQVWLYSMGQRKRGAGLFRIGA